MPIMRGGQRAKGVAQGGSLRHRRHLHHAKRNADAGADDQCDDDPLVLHQLGIEERGGDREGGADLAGQHAPARARRRTQPLERQNEQNDGSDVGEIEILLKASAVMISSACRF